MPSRRVAKFASLSSQRKFDDYKAYNPAKDIARKIENELQYPGEIKVNVIRETRVIEYAR